MLAWSTPPEGYRRWMLRLLADKIMELGYIEAIRHVTLGERLKREPRPWQVKSWCIDQPSARYVVQMDDVLDIYQRPYGPQRPVVRMDEKSTELRGAPRGTRPMAPGQEAREDCEYARYDTANFFLAVEPLAGRRTVRATARRTALDFGEELRVLVEDDYRDAECIVLVTDNLNTHRPT